MTTIIVLSSGQLVQSNIEHSFKSFAEKLHCSRFWLKLNLYLDEHLSYFSSYFGTISQYKKGLLNDEAFRTRLCKQLWYPNLAPDNFWEAWNAMCVISEETKEQLKSLAKLQEKYEFKLLIVGITNPSQNEYINQQLKDADITFDCDEIYSYEQGSLDFKTLASSKLTKFDKPGNTVISLHRALYTWEDKEADFKYYACGSKDVPCDIIEKIINAPSTQSTEYTQDERAPLLTAARNTPAVEESKESISSESLNTLRYRKQGANGR